MMKKNTTFARSIPAPTSVLISRTRVCISLLLHFSLSSFVFFDLFGGLPEEKIGCDSRSENGDERKNIIFIPVYLRDKSAFQNFDPVRVRHESGEDIGEDRKGEPFENPHINMILEKYFHENDEQGEQNRSEIEIRSREHFERRRHRPEIRSDVDDVRDDQDRRRFPGRFFCRSAFCRTWARPWFATIPIRAQTS